MINFWYWQGWEVWVVAEGVTVDWASLIDHPPPNTAVAAVNDAIETLKSEIIIPMCLCVIQFASYINI